MEKTNKIKEKISALKKEVNRSSLTKCHCVELFCVCMFQLGDMSNKKKRNYRKKGKKGRRKRPFISGQ